MSAFAYIFGLPDINPDTETLCLYIEFLAQNLKSPKSVANYLSAVKYFHKWLGEPLEVLEAFEVTLLLRACHLTMEHVPLQRRPLSPDLLRQMLSAAKAASSCFIVFRCAALFSFYGFLRMSNLTPRITSQFNPKKDTCRGDIFRAEPGLVILLKWTKTNQFGQNSELVPIPRACQRSPVVSSHSLWWHGKASTNHISKSASHQPTPATRCPHLSSSSRLAVPGAVNSLKYLRWRHSSVLIPLSEEIRGYHSLQSWGRVYTNQKNMQAGDPMPFGTMSQTVSRATLQLLGLWPTSSVS